MLCSLSSATNFSTAPRLIHNIQSISYLAVPVTRYISLLNIVKLPSSYSLYTQIIFFYAADQVNVAVWELSLIHI